MNKYKYSNKVLKTKSNVGYSFTLNTDLGNKEFIAEDYWININDGISWKDSNGNPAALEYALRIGMKIQDEKVPLDDNVVYGKIDGLGHLFHESELIIEGE